MGRFFTLLFCFIIFFVLHISCFRVVKPVKVEDIIVPTQVGPPIKFPITYYVDSKFTEHEFNVIQDGVAEIEKNSKGIVKIKLEMFTALKGYLPEFYTTLPFKTIWKLNREDPVIKAMFEQRGKNFAGFSYGNSVLIIMDYSRTDERLKAVLIHEMLHQIGMNHIDNKYPAIMNSNLGPLKITKWDMLQFCHFYKCKP